MGTSSVAVVNETYVVYSIYTRGRSHFGSFDLSSSAMGTTSAFTMGPAYAIRLRSVSKWKIALVATWDTEPAAALSASLYWTNLLPHDPELLTLTGWKLEGHDRLTPLLSRQPTCSRADRPFPIPLAFISCPTEARQAFVDPKAGDMVLATYYPPTNPNYDGGLSGELPPTIVNVHGEPAAFSHHGFSWEVQFFTSRGFAW